ncbi:hypothetical protein TNCV_2263001 [Trichonephila clavipes]|nr:hypothetical protein TNCV_2263001 [Trichonephila clavipes]
MIRVTVVRLGSRQAGPVMMDLEGHRATLSSSTNSNISGNCGNRGTRKEDRSRIAKSRVPERVNLKKRSPPFSLQSKRIRRTLEGINMKKWSPQSFLQSNRTIKRRLKGCGSKEAATSTGESVTVGTARYHTEISSYPITSKTVSRKSQGEVSAEGTPHQVLQPTQQSGHQEIEGFVKEEEAVYFFDRWEQRISQRTPSLELDGSGSSWKECQTVLLFFLISSDKQSGDFCRKTSPDQ